MTSLNNIHVSFWNQIGDFIRYIFAWLDFVENTQIKWRNWYRYQLDNLDVSFKYLWFYPYFYLFDTLFFYYHVIITNSDCLYSLFWIYIFWLYAICNLSIVNWQWLKVNADCLIKKLNWKLQCLNFVIFTYLGIYKLHNKKNGVNIDAYLVK